MITIDNPSLEAQLIVEARKMKIRVDELIERLLFGNINHSHIIQPKQHLKHDDEDVVLFSNHSANLIDEWKDSREDEVWKYNASTKTPFS